MSEAENLRLKEDLEVTMPGNNIDCVDCKFRLSGKIGYKNGYCEAFPKDVGGKPNGILFRKEKCPKKKRD